MISKAFCLHLLKDKILKLVLHQQNWQLGREIELGASSPGICCMPGQLCVHRRVRSWANFQCGLCVCVPSNLPC